MIIKIKLEQAFPAASPASNPSENSPGTKGPNRLAVTLYSMLAYLRNEPTMNIQNPRRDQKASETNDRGCRICQEVCFKQTCTLDLRVVDRQLSGLGAGSFHTIFFKCVAPQQTDVLTHCQLHSRFFLFSPRGLWLAYPLRCGGY